MDLLTVHLLSAGEGAQPCLSRQVRRRFTESVWAEHAKLSRSMSAVVAPAGLRRVLAHPVSRGLGSLRQAALWRTGACAAVSGPLHPPRGDLESSHRRCQRYTRRLQLEGLRAPQPAPHDELNPPGVPAPLPAACLAQGFPTDSLLWILGQSP